ncbi:MAG: hypothetical protein SWH54_04590 [Thermodesulfobacteriota bacterium]|nr:hypothetical protein [Thermodesulfobacteriota bacterium]
MTDIPTKEPLSFRAGDTVKWKKSLDDYPATSWTLKYFLVIQSDQKIITASPDGTDFLITITAAASAGYVVGRYSYQARVENVGGDKTTVGDGIVKVKPNLELATAGADYRSHVKAVLDALEATILGKASSDQLSYSIAGRSLSKLSPEELIAWRDHYRAEYLREERKAGRGRPQKIKVQFP